MFRRNSRGARSMRFWIVVFSFLLTAGSQSILAAPGDLDPTFGTGGKVRTPVGDGFEVTLASALQADGKIVVVGYIYLVRGSDIALIRYNPDGTLDSTFGVGGKVKTHLTVDSFAKAHSVAIQADGKIVIAGDYMPSNPNLIQVDFVVVRYNTDGSLDASFSDDGIVTTRFGPTSSGFASTVKIQADGKIVVAGDAGGAGIVALLGDNGFKFVVVRYNTDGSLDSTFGQNGIVRTNVTEVADDASSAVIQPDGKIIVAGFDSQFVNGSLITTRIILVRYNTDGSLDPTFGTNGIVITFPPNGLTEPAINEIALQAEGKIVGAGRVKSGFLAITQFLLTRYNPDGSLDPSLDGDGFATTRIGSYGDAQSVAVQRNGKIILAGYVSNAEDLDFGMARYSTTGALDSSFGIDGKVVTDLGTNSDDYAESILVQSNGKIVVTGGSDDSGAGRDYFAAARFQGDLVSSAQPLFDFDGDRKTDISIFRGLLGEWWVNRSSSGDTSATQFGTPTDRIVPADYTGDGKTDIAVWRPPTGEWLVLRSEDSSFFSVPFGIASDMPAPADFDGDGKADISVFRPSSGTWYILKSGGGITIEAFGERGDAPVVADYDADGRADIAIYRASVGQWWINRSTEGVISIDFSVILGSPKPVQGDYTGDGKADLAFFRALTGVWHILRSENMSVYTVTFGLPGDIPSPGDYDGDGRHDPTVFRPSTGTWYSQRSTDGILIQPFGLSNDRPVPNAFVPLLTPLNGG